MELWLWCLSPVAWLREWQEPISEDLSPSCLPLPSSWGSKTLNFHGFVFISPTQSLSLLISIFHHSCLVPWIPHLSDRTYTFLYCSSSDFYSSFKIQLTDDFSGDFPECSSQVQVGKMFLPHPSLPLTVPPKYFVCTSLIILILWFYCSFVIVCPSAPSVLKIGGQALLISVLINVCWMWGWVQLFALFTLSVMCSHPFINQALIKRPVL